MRGQHFSKETLSTFKVPKSQILGYLNSQKQAPNKQFKGTKARMEEAHLSAKGKQTILEANEVLTTTAHNPTGIRCMKQ